MEDAEAGPRQKRQADPNSSSEYRHLNRLNTIGIILELLMISRILDAIKDLGKPLVNERGFRQSRSTIGALKIEIFR